MVSIHQPPLLSPHQLFRQPPTPPQPQPKPQILSGRIGDFFLPQLPHLSKPTIQPISLTSPKTIPPKLQAAADAAYKKYKRKPTACESTANHLHRILLDKAKLSVRYLPRAKGLNENGKPLSYLKTLINDGRLKPGMVLFINTAPEMKMPKLSPSNRHWFTYMGLHPDTQKPVFCDQYGTQRSLESMLRLKTTRKPDLTGRTTRTLHTIFDPYGKNPNAIY